MSAARKAGRPRALAVALACALWLGATPARAQPTPPADLGRSLAGVLEYARQRHPELRALRHEADAARERIVPAGALPDPMFQVELRDVTNEMSGGSFNLLPARVGSTRYQLRQSLPAWGRREARRAVAQAGAEEAGLRADAAWAELAMRIKTTYARYQQVDALLVQNPRPRARPHCRRWRSSTPPNCASGCWRATRNCGRRMRASAAPSARARRCGPTATRSSRSAWRRSSRAAAWPSGS